VANWYKQLDETSKLSPKDVSHVLNLPSLYKAYGKVQ